MVALAHVVTALFVPADRPTRFASADAAGPDAVILDLEDAVSTANKDSARDLINRRFTARPVLVRINARATPWYAADMAAVTGSGISGIIVPKAEDPDALADCAQQTGLPVVALIETALGMANARAIAAARGVQRLAFGSVDYCADLGCSHESAVLLPARMELVLASRLAGLVAPLDGVTLNFRDTDACRDDARHARTIGMGGKLCIHPSQIPATSQAFRPDDDDIRWARMVINSKSDGVTVLDGQMVDEPVRARARAILARTDPVAQIG